MKKRSILLIAIGIIMSICVSVGVTTLTASADTSTIEYKMGDANLDGTVNTRDVVLIKQSIVGIAELTNEQKVFADTYADGVVNTRDVVLIQQYIVGMNVDLGEHEHIFEEDISRRIEATVYDDGQQVFICSVCGYEKTEIAPKISSFKVEFCDYDGALLYTENVVPSGLVSAPDEPERIGYSFGGWKYKSGETAEMPVEINEDIKFYADYVVTRYYVRFYADEVLIESKPFTIEDSNVENIPAVPEKTGYTGAWEFFTIVPSDIVVNAIYTLNKYSVTWKNYDGSILETDIVEYDTIPVYNGNAPTRKTDTFYSYNFNGWNPTVEKATQNAEYIATFVASESTSLVISYDANGGTNAPSSQTKNKGQSITLSNTVPSNGDHIFMGWQCAYDGNTYNAGAIFNVDANVTLYAIWGHECETCYGEGKVTTTITCSACSGNGKITKPSTTWINCSSCNGKGSISVSYSGVCSSCGGFGGSVLCNCSCGYSWWADQTGSRRCARCGNTVSGTRYTTCSNCNGTGTERRTSTSTCTACNGKGGRSVASTTITTCSTCSGKGTITRTETCSTCGGNKNIAEKYNSYMVSLKDNNNNVGTCAVTINSPYKLTVPVRSGYTFLGWFDSNKDGVPYTDSYGVSLSVWEEQNNKTLYSHWSLNYYTITYDCDKFVDITNMPTIYTVEDAKISLNIQNRNYYTFVWKFGNDVITQFDTALATDVTIKGIWTPIDYSIEYEYNCGTANNLSSYTIETNTFTLNNPTMVGYTFTGWTGSNGEIPQKDITIVNGSHGNLVYVANWQINQYTINFNSNGGSVVVPITQDYDSQIVVDNPILYGKSFDGWYNESFTVKYEKIPNHNITLYAKWIDYKITLLSDDVKWMSVSQDLTVEFLNVSATDTDGNEVTTRIEILKGTPQTRCDISFKVIASGLYDTTEEKAYSVHILDENESILYLYKNEEFIGAQRVYKGQNYTLPKEEESNVAWYYNAIKLTNDNGELLNVWSENSGIYELNTDYFTITYNVNEGLVDINTQLVNFGATYVLQIPTRIGYTFDGWYNGNKLYHDGIWLDKSNTTLTAKWIANQDTKYKVNHYKQNLDDDEYILFETDNLQGVSDFTVKPSVKTYEGFTSPSIESVIILADGSLVVDYYYARNKYDLTIIKNDGIKLTKQLKFGQNILNNIEVAREGYTFGGVFEDVLLENIIENDQTMPNAQLTLYAWWTEETKPSSFEYSGTSTIKVTGYKGTESSFVIPSYIANVPVTAIGNYAFQNLTITSAVVSNSVTSIGQGAFSGCSSLQEITIPFVGGSRKTANNTYQYPFGYIFGTSSYTGGKATTQYYYGSSTSSKTSDTYYIPSSLRKVTVTGGNILYGAFSGCSSLTSITIPDSVTSIGDYTFRNCSSLMSITIPDSVTSIGSYAFYNCSSLTSITIPNSVTSIGDSTFSGCSSLTSITIPNSVTSIGKSAFYNCSSLTSIIIPDSVTSIESQTFYNCFNLMSITIPDSVTSIGDYTFRNCSSLISITIPDSVTSIGYYAFAGCIGLTSINWNATSCSSAGSYSHLIFEGCSNIKAVNIGNNVIYIPPYAFYGCSSLTSVTIGNSVTSIGSDVFYNCSSLTSITIPNSVTSIGNGAFYGCSSLTSITIPDSVTSIGVSAFYGCSSLEYNEYENGLYLGNENNPFVVLIKTKSNDLSDFKINDRTKFIETKAFYNCSGITSITIPDSVTSIGRCAFQYCGSLTSITIPDSVTSIGDCAFYGCSSLTSITIPDSVTSIESQTFYNCFNLTSITIPDSVTSIGSQAFYNCFKLTSITIPEGITIIESWTFNGCSSLTSITIPDSVTSIGDHAFYNCSSLTSVTFNNANEWKVYASNTATNGTKVYVTNTYTAATCLTSTYVDKYWKRG